MLFYLWGECPSFIALVSESRAGRAYRGNEFTSGNVSGSSVTLAVSESRAGRAYRGSEFTSANVSGSSVTLLLKKRRYLLT